MLFYVRGTQLEYSSKPHKHDMLCYIPNVMRRYITHDMLCYITHVMRCYITHDMLCYITDAMLCYITHVILCQGHPARV